MVAPQDERRSYARSKRYYHCHKATVTRICQRVTMPLSMKCHAFTHSLCPLQTLTCCNTLVTDKQHIYRVARRDTFVY